MQIVFTIFNNTIFCTFVCLSHFNKFDQAMIIISFIIKICFSCKSYCSFYCQILYKISFKHPCTSVAKSKRKYAIKVKYMKHVALILTEPHWQCDCLPGKSFPFANYRIHQYIIAAFFLLFFKQLNISKLSIINYWIGSHHSYQYFYVYANIQGYV